MPAFGDADQEEWVLPENSMVHRQLSEKPMGRETTELFEAMVGKLTSLRMTGRVSGHVVPSRSRGGSEDFAHPLSSYDSTEGSESLTATNSSHQGASGTISTQSSFFRSRKSTDLLMDLSSDLLRGVPMHVLLRRFGVEWKQVSGPDALKWRPRLSRETRKYSFFFSHDWLTTRFAKYFALLIFFNGRAAAIATFLSSCTLGLLLGFQILQQGDDVRWYWIFANHVVGLFFLLFWQHIREALTCTERLGFLDRMCIPQHDQEKKIQCIYGLASFLNRSEQLIVLWSPRYFTRLWCVYEIACFLMKRKAADRIHFLPVQMPVVWLMAYCVFTQIFTVATYGQRDTNHTFDWYDQTGEGKINLVLLMIYMCTLFLGFYYFLNKMTSMMFELPEQLRNFHIDKANCFCCSNNHIHPATGEDMECDRELIYGVLQFWCGRSKVSQAILRDDENSRVHVEGIHQVFKKHLDKQLLPTIEETFTHTGFLMRPLMSAVVMAASPYLADFFSEEGRRIFLRLRENRVRNFGLWVHIFLVAIITLRLYLMIGQLGGRYWKGKWWWKMAVLITQVGLHMLIMVPMMMSYVMAIAVAGRGFFTSAISMLPLFLLAIEIPLTLWFTRHLCGCRRSKLIGGSPKERRTKKTEFAQEPLWEERVEEHKEAEEQIPDEKQAFETKVEISDAEKGESQDQEKSLSVRENVSTNASTMSPDQENVTFEGEEFNMDLSSDEESEPPPPVASAASMRSIFAI